MKKTAICLLLILLLVFPASCGRQLPAETGEGETTEKTAESSGTAEAAESTAAEAWPVIRSFGKPVTELVAGINERTLANEGSGVFDVLGDLSSVNSVDAVVRMLEACTLPDKATYGEQPVTEEIRQSLLEERDLETLKASKELSIRCGILTDNADVRTFPTELRATDTGAAEEYDYLQETKLCLGSGVLVLWTSKSGAYYFVQGYNYYGWVKAESVALTDEESFRAYLTPDDFLVCVSPVQSDPLKRLGEILPLVKSETDSFTYAVPVRNTDGTLRLEYRTEAAEEVLKYYHEGFLDWSEEACVELMRSLIGFPYGWGDTDNAYDCSSTIGCVYQCFGFVLPRNTGILKYFGAHSEDVEGKSYAELRELIASHPSAILVFKGHALMSCGLRTRDDGSEYLSIVHNTKGWSVSDGNGLSYRYSWCVTDSCPEEMLRADGTLTLDYLTRIIWVEE